MKLGIGVVLGVMLASALVSYAQTDAPETPPPIQAEYWPDEYNAIWFECWLSDGTIDGPMNVYVMTDPVTIYICPPGRPYQLWPEPTEDERRTTWEHAQEIH